MTCTNKGLTDPISVRLNIEATDGENLTKPQTTRPETQTDISTEIYENTLECVWYCVCSPEAARHVPEHRVLFAALRGRWKRISFVEELVKQRGGHNGPTIWRKTPFCVQFLRHTRLQHTDSICGTVIWLPLVTRAAWQRHCAPIGRLSAALPSALLIGWYFGF